MYLKKYILSAILFLLLSSSSFSQMLANMDRSFKAGTLIEYSENNNIRSTAWGLNFEILPGKRGYFAFNYRFLVGGSSNECIYVHTTLGGIAAATIIGASSKSGGDGSAIGYLAAALIIIPEGVTCYFNPSKKTVVGIYTNPLSGDYYYKSKDYEVFALAPEIGTKVIYKTSDIFGIQAHAGLKFALNDKIPNPPTFLNIGIGVTFHGL